MVDYGAIFSALHSYVPGGFELVYWGTWHTPWSSDLIGDWRNLITDKTPLVLGGTHTQVLADSMTIAASELNHCTN